MILRLVKAVKAITIALQRFHIAEKQLTKVHAIVEMDSN